MRVYRLFLVPTTNFLSFARIPSSVCPSVKINHVLLQLVVEHVLLASCLALGAAIKISLPISHSIPRSPTHCWVNLYGKDVLK